MKTILVTGANGFVGTHTLKSLMKQEGINLIAACRDKSKLITEFKGEVREGDFRDETYLDAMLEGVDVVCNAMAWTSLWGHKKQSQELYLKPMINLIDKVAEKGISRFINVSTSSAAAPEKSSDAMSAGIPRAFWPHLCAVIKIENVMRVKANSVTSMINMRLGIFAGEHYGLGILPILLPRLKTHLVPWVAGGKTDLPVIDGEDIGEAMKCAAIAEELDGYQSFNIVGKEVPTVREVIEFIHKEFAYPKPHFNVPFFIAYPFAWLMEMLDPIVPWEPLVNRSIVHLLEEVSADNSRATKILGYQPRHSWQDAVSKQIKEMSKSQKTAMRMARPIV
ncbi:MAG: NAD-dependent epimerase/dehydratase family protein [Gammaproteobacteria bacterium]|nr:NAD-dependent epimerase/dehydratase family protein [Gammaproteobacteria bacterium]